MVVITIHDISYKQQHEAYKKSRPTPVLIAEQHTYSHTNTQLHSAYLESSACILDPPMILPSGSSEH